MKLLNFIYSTMKYLPNSDEHRVLIIIANTLNLNHTNRMPILRQKIAEIAGWWDEDKPKYSLNKVSKITNTLEEKGFLKKDEIFNENGKSIIFYSIPMLEVSKKVEKKVESLNETSQKNVAHNSINSIKKINNIHNNYNMNSTNNVEKDWLLSTDF